MDIAVMSARIARAYPLLNPNQAALLAKELCAIERAQRRHAVRVRRGKDGVRECREFAPGCAIPVVEHDPETEERAGKRIEQRVQRWYARVDSLTPPKTERDPLFACNVDLQGDPRGRVLLVRFPGEAEAS
jgi:hypothetical protein